MNKKCKIEEMPLLRVQVTKVKQFKREVMQVVQFQKLPKKNNLSIEKSLAIWVSSQLVTAHFA